MVREVAEEAIVHVVAVATAVAVSIVVAVPPVVSQ